MDERNEKRPPEKLGEREIKMPPKQERPPVEHGKLWHWFDNFWYHYKWVVIGVLFVAVVLTVCIWQMATREDVKHDMVIVTAGPYGFTTDGDGLSSLKKCLTTYLPSDFDGDGEKRIKLTTYAIYSAEEAEEAFPEGGADAVRAQSTREAQTFFNYLQTGDAAIVLLSPSLFAEFSGSSMPLADVTGYFGDTLPDGAVMKTVGDGSEKCFGVRLGDTALWRENAAVRDTLSEDTVICLMRPLLVGASNNIENYNNAIATYLALTK